MSRYILITLFLVGLICCDQCSYAQSIQFSQFYNAPMLVNPAYTALLPDNYYRLGVNYRSQWAAIPVPYNTSSVFGDFLVAGGNDEHKNWLGIGAALFNDKAGDGNLSLIEFQGSAAYHIQLNDQNMLSVGFSGGYVQRSVDFDNLTFDMQWDGETFNRTLSNGEKAGILKTNYYTVGAGAVYTWSPNENLSVNLGASASNVNQPEESFYNSNNQVGIRPSGTVDVVVRANPSLIINPSAYYTEQDGASQILYGLLARISVTAHPEENTQFIVGGFCRSDDAVIPAVGFLWSGIQLLVSYDVTISSLAPYDQAHGAFEMSLIYTGDYGKYKKWKGRRLYNCPRFF